MIDRRNKKIEMAGMPGVHSKYGSQVLFKTRPQSRFEFLLVFFMVFELFSTVLERLAGY